MEKQYIRDFKFVISRPGLGKVALSLKMPRQSEGTIHSELRQDKYHHPDYWFVKEVLTVRRGCLFSYTLTIDGVETKISWKLDDVALESRMVIVDHTVDLEKPTFSYQNVKDFGLMTMCSHITERFLLLQSIFLILQNHSSGQCTESDCRKYAL